MTRSAIKEGLHPRNRFRERHDFAVLIAASPALRAFVARNAHGDDSIDFSNPKAVKALNQALLKHAYGLQAWDIPEGYLCPPIPGRSDYLLHLADLLGADHDGVNPRGPSVTVLDIGMGANCIYPLIGAAEHGWRFVGTEVDPVALRWAARLVKSNLAVADLIECRLQTSSLECFKGVVKPGEVFDLSMCNPPFHASAAEAAAGSRRKLRNLSGKRDGRLVLNFGGRGIELCCDGGELGFVRRMITQSAEIPGSCRWFTSLVSKAANLPLLVRMLRAAKVVSVRTVEMTHGQKESRILAWSFMEAPERQRQRQP